jgi:hypothetical protein
MEVHSFALIILNLYSGEHSLRKDIAVMPWNDTTRIKQDDSGDRV